MSVVANAFWLSTLRICADLLSFALFTFIARTYGPAGSGEYSYAFAIASLALLIATSGFEEYGVRGFARASPRENAAQWRDMLAAQLIQLLIGFLSLGLFLLVDGGQHARPAVVLELAVFLIGWGISHTFFVPAMAAQSMKTPAFTDLACRGSAIVLALLVGFVSAPDLPLLLSSFPLCAIVLVALAMRSARSFGAPAKVGRSPAKVIAVLRATAPFAGSELLNQFYVRADVLIIANLLGGFIGLYATDLKFVEVGLLPLNLLGVAAYPLLSRCAVQDAFAFQRLSHEFIRVILFFSGWLAVAVACLVPLLIVPLFGEKFAAAVPLLPWLSVLALVKGWESGLYRLLYASNKQMTYLASLTVGTILIVALNLVLIPQMGLRGAVIAGVASTLCVDLICAYWLRKVMATRFVLSTLTRLGVCLAAAAALFAWAGNLGLEQWTTAVLTCVAFPVLAYAVRLVPPLRKIELLGRHSAGPDDGIDVTRAEVNGAGPDI